MKRAPLSCNPEGTSFSRVLSAVLVLSLLAVSCVRNEGDVPPDSGPGATIRFVPKLASEEEARLDIRRPENPVTAIGRSRDGKIAYAVTVVKAGIGFVEVRWAITDLATGKLLWTAGDIGSSWLVVRDPSVTPVAASRETLRAKIEAAFARFGIVETGEDGRPLDLALRPLGDGVGVEIRAISGKAPEIRAYEVVATSGGTSRVVRVVEGIECAGARAIGWIPDPFGGQAALVVLESVLVDDVAGDASAPVVDDLARVMGLGFSP